MKYQEIEGDLIKLALEGSFDVIAHGCNCQCVMGAGLAPQMAKAFKCDYYKLEQERYKSDINKLGQIEYHPYRIITESEKAVVVGSDKIADLFVINCYTQFMYGTNHIDGVSKPLDYEALTLCLRKINHTFKDKHIGLPLIGCHLAGGIWDYLHQEGMSGEDYYSFKNGVKKDVKTIIQQELKDMDITIVHYKK